jgi:hypothetical protein
MKKDQIMLNLNIYSKVFTANFIRALLIYLTMILLFKGFDLEAIKNIDSTVIEIFILSSAVYGIARCIIESRIRAKNKNKTVD